MTDRLADMIALNRALIDQADAHLREMRRARGATLVFDHSTGTAGPKRWVPVASPRLPGPYCAPTFISQEAPMAAVPPQPVQVIPPGQVVEGARMADGKISPKATTAALVAALATLLIVAGHTIITGEFNATEIGEAVVGLGAALAALAGGYSAKPGQVVVGNAVQ